MFSRRCGWMHGKNGALRKLSPNDVTWIINNVVEPMANEGFRTLCLAYKDYVEGNEIVNFVFV